MQLKIDTVKEVKAVDFIDDVFVNTSTFKTSLLSMAEIKRNEILNAKKAKDVLDKDRTDKAYINMIFLSCIFGVTAAIKFFSGFAFFDIFISQPFSASFSAKTANRMSVFTCLIAMYVVPKLFSNRSTISAFIERLCSFADATIFSLRSCVIRILYSTSAKLRPMSISQNKINSINSNIPNRD